MGNWRVVYDMASMALATKAPDGTGGHREGWHWLAGWFCCGLCQFHASD